VKVTYSIDEDLVAKVKQYSKALHVSSSAFVSLVLTQIDSTVVTLGALPKDEVKPGAGTAAE
jgi:hypothetical protein